MRVCMRVHMIVWTPQDTRQRPAHQRNTRPEERGTQAKREICLYIGLIADNEKKYKKS